MKRSPSKTQSPKSQSSDTGSGYEERKPAVGTPKKREGSSKHETTPKKQKTSTSEGDAPPGPKVAQANGEWTPEKRAQFFDAIVAAGYKACDLDGMSSQLGMNKKQLINQLQPGRKGSFRDKAVQAVRGEK